MSAVILMMLTSIQKPDSAATKELCIVALTKIYCMTHPYQTLVREITTPTLPGFITSCLSLLSSRSSKALDSTIEVVFRSFATLLPRHTTIYRPFASQIRSLAKPFIAPTASDGAFVPSSLAISARRLVVILHQTVAKNAGGEEWAKAVQILLRDIHVTADRVFRAVVEDWESAVGYIGEPVDVNLELHGGAKNPDDLPGWTGIDTGVERVVGLLELLKVYLQTETLLPVTIPLGVIVDIITRMLSVATPSTSRSSTGPGSVRLHPAIDRDERDGLWSGMPQIYVAAVQVISTMAETLQEAFMPVAKGFLDQLAWVFPYGKHDSDFRLHSYRLTVQLLLQNAVGGSPRKSSSQFSGIIRSCCNDLIPVSPKSSHFGPDVETAKKSNGNASNTNQNADLFLQNNLGASQETAPNDTELTVAAKDLLPLFLSRVPQQHLDISLRALIERTAILSHNKNAMLAGILNPFIGKNGKSMASILPHFTRAFPHDDTVEILLRPRMPLVPSTVGTRLFNDESTVLEEEDEDEEMEMYSEHGDFVDSSHGNAFDVNESFPGDTSSTKDNKTNHPGLGKSMPSAVTAPSLHDFGTKPSRFKEPTQQSFPRSEAPLSHSPVTIAATRENEKMPVEVRMDDGSDSDGESVHLTMQLDTDSESEG
jgi:pre-rRNA-processing protein RIX1